MENKQQNLPLQVSVALAIATVLLLAVSALNSPRAQFSSAQRPQSYYESLGSQENILYKNVGLATKSMFFHELKKTRR